MHTVHDSFQWEPDQGWQEEVLRISTEKQPLQARKATQWLLCRALRAVPEQGSESLSFPCTCEELHRLPSSSPVPPHKEKKAQSNVVRYWDSSCFQALSLPQIASQLELLLLHTHLKDSSGSTSFSGDVPLGLGSRCLARSDPHSCPVHVLLIQANNFHWRRLGVLMATEQWISVQSEFDVLYLSCHKIACFQIVEQLCGEWNRAVIIYMYERYFKTHLFLHLVQTLPGWMLGGWRSIHTFCFGKASLPVLQCGWGICLSSGYSFSVRLGKEKTNQTQHSIWGHNVFRVGWQW